MNKDTDERDLLRLLSGMTRLMQGCPEESDILNVAWWYLPVMFRNYDGQLHLPDSPTGIQSTSLQWGPGTVFPLLPDPDFCPAQRKGTIVMAGDQDCPGCIRTGDWGCCVPMPFHDQSMGMLRLVQNAGKEKSLIKNKDRILGLVSVVAESLTLAIDNLRRNHLLEKASLRDPLTGLFNRRYLDDCISQTMSRAKRFEQEFGLILFDVDFFKQFNDQWGHVAGDEALKAIGKFLLKNLREGDVPCRIGGEEFLVVLHDCNYEDALIKADELRRGICQFALKSASGQRMGLTISAGVATYPVHGDNFKQLYSRADRELYKVKKINRNQIPK